MNNLRKKGTKYTELERKSYLREYLASTETKRQFYKRTGIASIGSGVHTRAIIQNEKFLDRCNAKLENK